MPISRCALLLALAPLPLLAGGHPVSMWQVDGQHNRVYLLGSVHLLREQDHPLPAVIDAAYRDAEALVMELDMDDLDPVLVQQETRRFGVLQDERTLRDLLGEQNYLQAETAARSLEIPIDLLAKTEPWFAAITVEQLVLLRLGFNPAFGVEMTLIARAAEDGKPISGLETIEEQLQFLDGLSPDAQSDLLLQTLSESDTLQEEMGTLIDAWRNGDTAFMEEFLLADMQESPELYAAIVTGRNRAWTTAIEALLDDDDDYLVIVGALHLIGKDGVPALLEQRGYKARQMNDTL
jgi:uncharacterized protein